MPEGEQPLEVLPSGDQQGLGVDPPQGPQAKAAQPMPHLGLRKERLDPHLALPERLAVRLGLGVGAYLLQKLVAWVAVDAAPLGVGGALGSERAGVADGGSRAVLDAPAAASCPTEELSRRTHVGVLLRVVAELALGEEAGLGAALVRRNVGPNPRPFQGGDVLCGTVFAVAGDVVRAHPPPKDGPP